MSHASLAQAESAPGPQLPLALTGRRREASLCVIALLTLGHVVAITTPARAIDVFDRHDASVLGKVLTGEPVPALSLAQAAKLKSLSSTLTSPCVAVKTDEGNVAKVMLAWAVRKTGDKLTPVLLIERFVTYRADRPDMTAATGGDVMLFPGFAFNLDIGQVVPEGQGADIRFADDQTLVPIDKSKVVPLDGSLLPEKTTSRATRGAEDVVTVENFAGEWTLDADGRWSGTLTLAVDDKGQVSGQFVSGESQSTYDVQGVGASAPHQARLEVYLANAQMNLDAYLWTTDRATMAGTVSLAGQKFGFVARRALEN